MEEIKTIIELLDKIRAANNKVFNSCPEERLLKDIEYGNLYQAFWMSDFRIKNGIELLKVVERNMSCGINF